MPARSPIAAKNRREEVGVVVRQVTLQDGRHPFEPHAGIDRGRRQGNQLAIGLPIELHEHVVPDLDVAVAAALDAAARAARQFLPARHAGAAEEIDLGAASARPRIAHRPEVIVRAQLADPFGGKERPPDVVGPRRREGLLHRP